MKTDKIKIIAVDDSPTFLEAIEFYFSEVNKYLIINTANNGEEAIRLNNLHEADIILMDIEMPKLNGIKATKQLLYNNRHFNIIALTGYEEDAHLITLISAGFKGCVFKRNTFNQITNAISTVLNGGLFFPDTVMVKSRM